MVVEVRSK
ncbi:Protein of unknown function [Escherichia coli D6-117.29]|nr:Protein of unknown function [Escherichia coli D6-113.11]CDP72112.1 Protein of unknown function [Escherichia coli]CDP78188.1 Protein of unknown function [Escherichia coli D6-117.29]CDU35465.1 Protein of unknown function [Escherichia coli D6-113.11]CDU39303.1 Protein of unknown function [Escherichia coli]